MKILKNNNLLFIIVIFFIIGFGMLTLIKGEKDVSHNENRTLAKLPHLTIHGYLSGEYQSYLSNALSDQFIFGETIKQKFHEYLTFIDYNKIPRNICKNRYVNLNDIYVCYNCNQHIMFKYNTLSEEASNTIQRRLEVYGELNNYIDTYYYFLSTSAIYNFEKNEYSIDLMKIVKENLEGDYEMSSLTFNNYEDFANNFYKTDHHWNHKGSYKAYKSIIDMMTNDKPLEPVQEIVFDDIYFSGSAARSTQIFSYDEKFSVYKFDIPKYTVLVNGKEGEYGKESQYFKGIYDTNRLVNHYGVFYGGDDGEIVFDFNKPKKDNILILGSSYTNAINKLIASHFNRTYIVDLRHYDYSVGEKFNIKKYIDENDIDKVLIIADYNFLQDTDFDIEWSE